MQWCFVATTYLSKIFHSHISLPLNIVQHSNQGTVYFWWKLYSIYLLICVHIYILFFLILLNARLVLFGIFLGIQMMLKNHSPLIEIIFLFWLTMMLGHQLLNQKINEHEYFWHMNASRIWSCHDTMIFSDLCMCEDQKGSIRLLCIGISPGDQHAQGHACSPLIHCPFQ